MKIFCISDTESPPETLKIWLKFCKNDLKSSDKIFHLGDGIKNIKEMFSDYKTSYIKGNHDMAYDCNTKELRKNINNHKFYLFHGRRKNIVAEKINMFSNHLRKKFGMRISLDSYYNQLFRTYKNKHDIVLYGHMHTPRIDIVENTIFLCPGSFSHKSSIKKPTYATIDVSEKNKKEIKIIIFSIKNKKNKIEKKYKIQKNGKTWILVKNNH